VPGDSRLSFIREEAGGPVATPSSLKRGAALALVRTGPRTSGGRASGLEASAAVATTTATSRQQQQSAARRSEDRTTLATACRPAAGPRSLINDFDDQSDSDEGACDADATPAKWLRAACPEQAVAARQEIAVRNGSTEDVDAANAAEVHGGCLLAPLPAAVVAQVASYLSFQETARLKLVVSGACSVLSQPAAWDPLVLNFEECGRVLRRLRERDPLALLVPSNYPLLAARALTEVTELRVELMEPDRVQLPEDEEGEEGFAMHLPFASPTSATPRSSPARLSSPELVMDPLEELTRRLRSGWFPRLLRAEISNIEGHRLDYCFLQLRGRVFGSFPWLRVHYEQSSQHYTLSAARTLPAAPGGAPVACHASSRAAAVAANSARQPQQASFLLKPAEVSDVEALFLEEHAAVFKSGEDFHFVHAPWRTYKGAQVRQLYGPLLGAIRAVGKEASEQLR